MANNLMYLVHRPTGLAVYLGKRMAWGWYNVPSDLAERVNALFKKVEDIDRYEEWYKNHPGSTGQADEVNQFRDWQLEEHWQDDFAIAMESSESPFVVTDWQRVPRETDDDEFTLRLPAED